MFRPQVIGRSSIWRAFARSGALVPLTIMSARVLGAALGLILSLLMVRTMGPHEMGRALTAMSLAMLLPILASASSEAGASRFLTQALFRNDHTRAAGFIRMTWQVAAVCTPIVLVIGCAAIFQRMDSGDDRLAFLIAILSAAFMGPLRIGSAHAMGFSRVIVATLPGTFLRPLVLLSFLALYFLVSPDPPTAPVVLACFFLSAAVNLVLQQALLARSYRSLAGVPRDLSARREWIGYGAQMGATLLFIEYSKDITVLFSSLSLGPSDVARLSVALSFVGFARFAVIAVNQSVTPELSRRIASGDDAGLIDIVDRSNLMKFLAAITGLVMYWLFGPVLLGIYDAEFARTWWLLPVLMADPVCLALFGPSSNVLSLSGRQRKVMMVSLIMVPVLMALVVLGGYLFGLGGAAVGATLAWAVFYGILSFLVWRDRLVNLTLFGTLVRRLY